ncbi:MAG: type IV pili methyl-accepting chemotaxis transducer N-terminal domain-containing protein, partial [Planctomycetes bacterium]|nr:type IV pili methyl-accepting chemotaxis transducer N-terminal domain-containing protein [Planctomycetota bacterium]
MLSRIHAWSVATKLYSLPALFIATLIAMVSYTVVQLQGQAKDTAVAELAGRQRMLTQRFTEQSLAEMLLKDESAEAGGHPIENTVQVFEATLHALQSGGQTYCDLGMQQPVQVEALAEADLQANLSRVASSWAELQRLSTAAREGAASPDQVHALLTQSDETLSMADVLVAQMTALSDGKTRHMILVEIAMGCAAAILGLLVARQIAKGIVQPLRNTDGILARMADGDLTGTLDESIGGEMGSLARSINRFVATISSGLERVQSTTQEIREGSVQINGASQSLAAASSEQSASMEDVSAALEEISIMATSNAEHAGTASGISNETRTHAAQST